MNPYEPPDVDIAMASAVGRTVEKWQWLDLRCLLVACLSILLGAVSWNAQPIIWGTAKFSPPFEWLVFSGFLTSCIDPRSPSINCAMIYFGGYILLFPFLPHDPYLVLPIVGIAVSTTCVVLGSLIPTFISYVFPIKNTAFRRWAGFRRSSV